MAPLRKSRPPKRRDTGVTPRGNSNLRNKKRTHRGAKKRQRQQEKPTPRAKRGDATKEMLRPRVRKTRQLPSDRESSQVQDRPRRYGKVNSLRAKRRTSSRKSQPPGRHRSNATTKLAAHERKRNNSPKKKSTPGVTRSQRPQGKVNLPAHENATPLEESKPLEYEEESSSRKSRPPE